MESGAIVDADITASSSFDSGNVGPHRARWVNYWIRLCSASHAKSGNAIRIRKFDHTILAPLWKKRERRCAHIDSIMRPIFKLTRPLAIYLSERLSVITESLPAKCSICTVVTGSQRGNLRHRRARSERGVEPARRGNRPSSPRHAIDHLEVSAIRRAARTTRPSSCPSERWLTIGRSTGLTVY